MKRFRFLLSAFLLCAFTASAENLYVRPSGGTGAGTSWTAAWNGFNAVRWGGGDGYLGAGDTLWIAGGNYDGPFNIGGSGTAGARIYIKRALASESACTGAAGWSAGYDATVYITAYPTDTPVGFGASGNNGSYVTVDGGVAHAGFDIYLTYQVGGMNQSFMGGVSLTGETDVTDFTFRNAYIHGAPGVAWNYTTPNTACRGMNLAPSGGHQNKNITISYVSLRYCNDAIYMGRNDNTIIEHCIWRDIVSNGGDNHPNNIFMAIEPEGPHNTTVRYCLFNDAQNTGVFFASARNSDNPWNETRSGWYIYGNVFNDLDETWARSIQLKTSGNVLYDDVWIVNNTFVNVSSPISFSMDGGDRAPQGYCYNNIYCQSPGPGYLFPNDSNHYTNSDTSIFVNVAALNFQLNAALPGGYAYVGSGPMLLDPQNYTRGSDGVWDIGAYEFNGTAAAPDIYTNQNNMVGGVGTNFSQTMLASGGPTNWAADNLPAALQINSDGTIAGYVTNAVTNLTITLRAYNATGGDTQAVSATFYPLAPSLFVSPTYVNFPVQKTGTLGQFSFIISNHTGLAGTTATGIVHQITDPAFSIIGDTNWNLTGTATKTITVGYSNAVVTTNSGYLTITTSGTPLTNTLYGRAAPVASGTNFSLREALLIPPMTTNANNQVYNTVETDTQNPNGWAWFFINAPAPGYFNFALTVYGATNGPTDSIYWWFKDGWKVIDMVDHVEGLQAFITRTNNDIWGGWVTNYNYTNLTGGDILVGVGGRETPVYTTNISWQFFATGGSDVTPPDTYAFDYPTNSGFTVEVATNSTGIGGTAGDSDGDLLAVYWTNATTGVSGTATGTTTWTNYPVSLNVGNNTIYMTVVNTNSLSAVTNITVYWAGTVAPVSGATLTGGTLKVGQ